MKKPQKITDREVRSKTYQALKDKGLLLPSRPEDIEKLEQEFGKFPTGTMDVDSALSIAMKKRVMSPVPESDAVAEKPKKSAHNWAFNEAVVIAMLADEFGNIDYPLGRLRYTKLAYLLHRRMEHVAKGYLKKAAGPYNPATRYAGPEKIAQNSGYILRHKRERFEGFIAGEKVAQAREYFLNWYGQPALDWLQQFRFWKKEMLERVATVDMAMEELRRTDQEITVATVKTLIASAPEWVPKLNRTAFSDENIATAITQCRELFSD